MTLCSACFLDIDGTLVRAFSESMTTRGPRTIEEIELLDEVKEDCNKLRQAGFVLIGCTNKPDVARGIISQESAALINQRVVSLAGLDDCFACFHDNGPCCCRKPRIGLLVAAAYKHDIDLSKSWIIGDRETDMMAGKRSGCQCFRIKTNSGIGKAVEWILAHQI